jgi:hypothetical protein
MIACICGGVVEGCLLCTFLASMFGLLFKKHKHDCKCCVPKDTSGPKQEKNNDNKV